MKKLGLIILLGFTCGILNAQVIFEEDFQDQAYPEGTIFYDIDERTDLMVWPELTLDDMLNWYILAHYATPDNYSAWSTGFSNSFVAGPVDNWFIIPAITIPPQSTIYYDAMRTATSNNNPYSEFVQLLVSTTGTDTTDFVVIDEYETTLNSWNTMSVSLDDYAGQSVYFAFRNYGEYGVHMLVDNISVVSEASIIDDVEIVDALPEDFYLPPGSSDLNFTLKNTGTSTIESVDLSYSIDNGANFETTALTGLNVGFNETYQTSISDFINISEVGGYEVMIKLSNPNGNIDPTPENNTITRLITIIENTGDRKVMLEEFTGTWCGWCPRGAIIMRELLLDYPEQLIGLAYHQGDPMEITEFEELVTEIPMVNGFPSGSIDRYPFNIESPAPMSLGTEQWEGKLLERLSQPTPLNITGNLDYNEDTKELNVGVDVNFVSDDIGEFRINCILVESGITGYPQSNYYNDDPNSYPELYQAGDPIIDYEHNHVVRAMLGGAFGAEDVIPYNVTGDDNFNYEFAYTIPENMVPENMNVIVYVSKHPEDFVLGRNILNANEYHLSDFISGIESPTSHNFSVYPNPATHKITIEVFQPTLIRIMDLAGKVLIEESLDRSAEINIENLKSGVYVVNAISEAGTTCNKLVKK